jgi:hypothetical protein
MNILTREVVLYPADHNPFLSNRATYVSLQDEGGGAFIDITQHDDSRNNTVRFDFEEIEHLLKAVNLLRAQKGLFNEVF